MNQGIPEWHRLSADEALARLASRSSGLEAAEVAERLVAHGANRLPEVKPRPPWVLFLQQFRNILSLVLIAAAGVALLIGDALDAGVMVVVVLFNAVLGFYQEHSAERILDALRRMLAPHTAVRRGGLVIRLPSHELVPGDIVLLDCGSRVPADGRLLAAHSLEVDEASLTGESTAVAKRTDTLDADLPLAERANMAFSNTVVTRGRGELLVTATGANTEIGRLVGLLRQTRDETTPLQAKLDHLGKLLALIAVLVIALILAMGLLRGEPLAELLLTAIALAVAAIPEGLPAVVTVTLAIGMRAMTRRGAIVKRLSAVETLGSTTVICTDKTGTLTLNQMTARAVLTADGAFEVSGEGYDGAGHIAGASAESLRPLLQAAVLCNDSRIEDGHLIGEPTEGALVALAAKGGVGDIRRDHPRLAELPFDSDRKFMATLHATADGPLLCVKGAPDVLFERCVRIRTAKGERPFDAATRERLRHDMEALAGRALRVLAVVSRPLPAAMSDLSGQVNGLTLLGLVGIMDPPRPEARKAIAACARAGIAVKMITGDHRATAAAIARELGIGGDVVSGVELGHMSGPVLAERIGHIGVFARVAPEHKLRIVNTLKTLGHVVAMTGDGVNDAPALKAADIGVAMGASGTEVAREAAAMVLTDDNFATIVGAVHQGRTIYDNIVKFLRFQLSTNIGALLTVFAAPLAGLPVPFNPIQILWVNIIMDGPPAMALAFDPARRGIMDDPPRPPGQPILGAKRLLRLAAYGATMALGTLLLFHWALAEGMGETHARTLAFTTFVLFQFFNVFNARVGRRSALNRAAMHNRKLMAALAAVLTLQALAVHWGPAQRVFHTTDLDVADWAAAVAMASTVILLDEGRKLLIRLTRRRRLAKRR